MRLGVRAALVDGVEVAGDVVVADGRIASVGAVPAARSGVAVPGLIDLHVNGFDGVDFLTADRDGYGRAGAAMAATGVTAYLPTFVSSPIEQLVEALGTVAGLPGMAPRVLGSHLEGPFLSPRWPGAHDPAHLRSPDRELAERLCAAGPVRMVTLAPELDGGLELVEWLCVRSVVASLGHTDADAATAHRAFDLGAKAITHVHNAHRRWEPRDPGPAGAALVRPDVTVQAIVDGIHLAPETSQLALLAARERFCLVTDAVEAAGTQEGRCRVGGRTASVADGAVRLADGTLAGSVLSLDQAVRNLVAGGTSLPDAVHAATAAPAKLLGDAGLGVLHEGSPADIAVLDDRLQVERTLVDGVEVFAARS